MYMYITCTLYKYHLDSCILLCSIHVYTLYVVVIFFLLFIFLLFVDRSPLKVLIEFSLEQPQGGIQFVCSESRVSGMRTIQT